MKRWPSPLIASACGLFLWICSRSARGVDVGNLGDNQAQVDVTETSIIAQRFDARDHELPQDTGWGTWINRLNAMLRWGRWTAGLRLDSSVFWRRPIDNPNFPDLPTGEQNQIGADNESRYKNSIYPAKLWIAYVSRTIEVTAGDAYVQFGRGLTLSMRKLDELGIDTTLRGVKVQVQDDPFALVAVAGFANPARIDEATGRVLFPTSDIASSDRSAAVFGSDRIVGLDLQAGRGLALTLSTHVVHFTRCAPYRYDANGNVVTDFWTDPVAVTFGTCDRNDTARWLGQLGNVPPTLDATEITQVGQTLEAPTLWGHGKLYIEAAAQQRHGDVAAYDQNVDGNALYGALSLYAPSVALTLEVKSNRNFYVVPASIDPKRAGELSIVAYSFLPPVETFNMIDTEGTGNNACVNGGRLRADLNLGDNLMVYAQGIAAHTQSEQTNGGCDALGHTRSAFAASTVQDRVWDGLGGLELYFDGKLSHAFAWFGARDDTRDSGDWFYREQHLEYSIVKYLGGAWSLELHGRHRRRREDNQNVDPVTYVSQSWTEGENYVALKIGQKWVFTQGFEYTTLTGQPPYYFNGAVFYKFTSSSNVRVFVGQQRGAFRCASGVCRYFPPFEGARAEVTLRF